MTTRLDPVRQPDGTYLQKEVSRELPVKVSDSGSRKLVVTVRSDGALLIRAKGLKREVYWKLDALYEKGLKEGRSI